MLGSPTTPDRVATRDNAATRVAFRLRNTVGIREMLLSRLDGQPIGLYDDPTEWPWTYVGIICTHGMFAIAQAGRSFGIDNLLAKRLVPGFRHDGLVARAIALAS